MIKCAGHGTHPDRADRADAGAQVCLIVGELGALLFGAAEQSISRKLSRRVFTHVMALPLRFDLARATGAVAQTLENGL